MMPPALGHPGPHGRRDTTAGRMRLFGITVPQGTRIPGPRHQAAIATVQVPTLAITGAVAGVPPWEA